MTKPYVITVVGPESSGKTTLASNLATQLGCLWVPEYARTYLNQLAHGYELSDLNHMADGQHKAISEYMVRSLDNKRETGLALIRKIISSEAYLDTFGFEESIHHEGNNKDRFAAQFFKRSQPKSGQPVLIVDSGMLSLNIWAKLKYNTSLPIVDHYLEQDQTSAYILCRPTLPWAPDPLREAPGLLERVWIYNHYLSAIVRMISK